MTDELVVDVPLNRMINENTFIEVFIEKDVIGIVELNYVPSIKVPGFREINEVFFFTVDIVKQGKKTVYKTKNKRNQEIQGETLEELLTYIYV